MPTILVDAAQVERGLDWLAEKINQQFGDLAFVDCAPPAQDGQVRVTHDIEAPLTGKHLLVAEGMLISGKTPNYICEMLYRGGARNVELASAGWKPELLITDFPTDFALYEFSDEFVTGYGIGKGSLKSSRYLVERV